MENKICNFCNNLVNINDFYEEIEMPNWEPLEIEEMCGDCAQFTYENAIDKYYHP